MSGYNAYGASAQKTEKGGRSFRTFKEWPEGTKFHKITKEGNYGVDIIPHRVKNKSHPAVRDGAAIGETVYGFQYWRHANVGPEKLMVVCPLKTFGHKCPICELADQMKAEHGYKSKEYTDLAPKSRVIYNVVLPEDDKEEVLLMDESWALFEKEMILASKNKAARKGKDYIRFADVEEGYTVFFAVERQKLGTFEFNKYSTFDFEKRDEAHDVSIIKKTISPDEYITEMSYEQLEALLNGDSFEDAEAEDEDVAEEEAPVDKGPKCPAGLKYGRDYDPDRDECDDCTIFRDCRKQTRLYS